MSFFQSQQKLFILGVLTALISHFGVSAYEEHCTLRADSNYIPPLQLENSITFRGLAQQECSDRCWEYTKYLDREAQGDLAAICEFRSNGTESDRDNTCLVHQVEDYDLRGVRLCKPRSCVGTKCQVEGGKRWVRENRRVAATSVQECMTKCKNNRLCKAYNYLPTDPDQTPCGIYGTSLELCDDCIPFSEHKAECEALSLPEPVEPFPIQEILRTSKYTFSDECKLKCESDPKCSYHAYVIQELGQMVGTYHYCVNYADTTPTDQDRPLFCNRECGQNQEPCKIKRPVEFKRIVHVEGINSDAECRLRCRDSQDCQAYSYSVWDAEYFCYNFGIQEPLCSQCQDPELNNAIENASPCKPTSPQNSIGPIRTKIVGKIKAENQQDCMAKCSNSPGRGFCFFTSSKNCFRMVNIDRQSGDHFCSPNCYQPDKTCPAIKYVPLQILTYWKNFSEEKCMEGCRRRHCKVVYYSSKSRSCTLFGVDAVPCNNCQGDDIFMTTTIAPTTSSEATGMLTCKPISVDNPISPIRANHEGHFKVNNEAECIVKAEEDTDNKFYDYDGPAKGCTRHSYFDNSGTETKLCYANKCQDQNSDCTAYEMAPVWRMSLHKLLSLQGCIEKCQNTNGCKVYRHNKQGGKCFLLGGHNAVLCNDCQLDGMTTTPPPPTTTTMKPACKPISLDNPVTPIRANHEGYFTVNSEAECIAKAEEGPDNKFYHYDANTKGCARHSYYENSGTETKLCYEDKCDGQNPDCMEYDMASVWRMTYHLNVPSVEACIEICQNTNGCKVFRYNDGNKKCFLLGGHNAVLCNDCPGDGMTTTPPPPPPTTTTSMKLACKPISSDNPVTPIRANHEGYFKVNSEAECIAKAAEGPDNKFYHYDANTKGCARHSYYENSGTETKLCYEDKCDGQNTDCTEYDIAPVWRMTYHLNVPSLEACIERCQNTDGCKVFRFNDGNKKCFLLGGHNAVLCNQCPA